MHKRTILLHQNPQRRLKGKLRKMVTQTTRVRKRKAQEQQTVPKTRKTTVSTSTTVSEHDTDITTDDDNENMRSNDEIDDGDFDEAATAVITLKKDFEALVQSLKEELALERISLKEELVQRLEQRLERIEAQREHRLERIEAKMVPNEVGPRSAGVSSITTPSNPNLSVAQLKICKSIVKQTLNDRFFSIKKFLTTEDANDIIEGTETLKQHPITARMVLENLNSIRQSSQIYARNGYMSKSLHGHINGGIQQNKH